MGMMALCTHMVTSSPQSMFQHVEDTPYWLYSVPRPLRLTLSCYKDGITPEPKDKSIKIEGSGILQFPQMCSAQVGGNLLLSQTTVTSFDEVQEAEILEPPVHNILVSGEKRYELSEFTNKFNMTSERIQTVLKSVQTTNPNIRSVGSTLMAEVEASRPLPTDTPHFAAGYVALFLFITVALSVFGIYLKCCCCCFNCNLQNLYEPAPKPVRGAFRRHSGSVKSTVRLQPVNIEEAELCRTLYCSRQASSD